MIKYEYKYVLDWNTVKDLALEGWRLHTALDGGAYILERVVEGVDEKTLTAIIAKTLENVERSEQFKDDHPQDTYKSYGNGN